MTTQQSHLIEATPFEFLPQGQNLIDILDADNQQALHLSQAIDNPLSRWQSYLALLAFFGFTEWIETFTEAAGLTIDCDTSQARLIVPSQPSQPAAISQIYLNRHFRLDLIATTGDPDDTIDLPSAIVEQSKQLAHFYLNINVNPEAQAIALQGFLRHDQLQTYRTQNHLAPTNGIYSIPTEQFEPRIDRFLFLTSHLNPAAIPLPQTSLSLTPIKQLLIQPIINTRTWLQEQLNPDSWNQILDRLGQSLEPLLVPSDFRELRPATDNMRGTRNSGWRGPDTNILQAITQQGYNIPIDVRVNYQNLSLDEQEFRLTFVTWQIPMDDTTPTTEPEWSLLIIGQLLENVTHSLRISVQQMGNIMATEQINSTEHYQIFQAIGFLDEQFTIEVATDQSTLILPPIQFEPNLQS